MTRTLRLLGTALLTALVVVMTPTLWSAWPVIQSKIAGKAVECSWADILWLPRTAAVRGEQIAELTPQVKLVGSDEKLGLQQFSYGNRTFWIGKEGHELAGKQLLVNLIADHKADAESANGSHVHKGDFVIDVGAHVGVFTAKALELGAAKVVAVEPDPTNIECLRRNFANEIKEGRVVIYPKGAWSSATTLTFHESSDNSGMPSAVIGRDGATFQLAVEQLDKIAEETGLKRVDFIKMDIEGAEREALKGARNILNQFHPRLMVDAYHRPDDMPQLRSLLTGYTYKVNGCRDCDQDPSQVVPRVTFWAHN